MLTQRQVATLRAALLFWQEEMCPHGSEVMRPYMDAVNNTLLNSVEITELRDQFKRDVRYAIYDSAKERLDGLELFQEIQEAEMAAGGRMLACVILPASFAAGT